LAGFCGQKEIVAMVLHPRPDTFLRIAVDGGCVNVVQAIFQQYFEEAICLFLCPLAKGIGTEYQARALVPGVSEWLFGNHNYALQLGKLKEENPKLREFILFSIELSTNYGTVNS
jgi:hypothetical protein